MKFWLTHGLLYTIVGLGMFYIGYQRCQLDTEVKLKEAMQRGMAIAETEHNLLKRREDVIRMEALGAPTCKLDRALLNTIIRMCERQKCV